MKKLFFLTFVLFCTSAFAKLDPNVIAQVFQSSGCLGYCPPSGARILDNGTIEDYDHTTQQWNLMGTMTSAKLTNLKKVTDVMMPQELYTDPNQPHMSDMPEIIYEVLNAKGETVMIARDAERYSYLTQGGALMLIDILKGLRNLSLVSY